MAFNGFPDHCYFVRHFPIDRIWYKKEHLVWEETEWCVALEEDIRENGLISPILIDGDPLRKHREALACGTTDEYHVYCGHHRVQAMHRIGWTHVPVVIYGVKVPEEWAPEVIKNKGHAETFFKDGVVDLRFFKLSMLDTHLPETMVYPPNTDPYWPSSPLPIKVTPEDTLEAELAEYET